MSFLVASKSLHVLSGLWLHHLFPVKARPNPLALGFVEDKDKTRIYYGQEAAVGQFPHMLSLVSTLTDNHWCGAVLVTEAAALTTAYCVDPT